MRELSLFSGAGGSLLGSLLLGWKTIGAVEIDEYCCKVLEQRQKDGWLDDFPIWQMDIRKFNGRVAEQYAGMVDVVTAGFPCQPFSLAGKQLAADDPRNGWPATIDTIRRVKPRFCFLENVPGLLSQRHGYFQVILKDLAESGYHGRWKVISAAEVGAPHKRDRLWILADAKHGRLSESGWPMRKRTDKRLPLVSYPWPPRPSAVSTIPAITDGSTDVVDELKSLGNMQVPQCMAAAWRVLTGG